MNSNFIFSARHEGRSIILRIKFYPNDVVVVLEPYCCDDQSITGVILEATAIYKKHTTCSINKNSIISCEIGPKTYQSMKERKIEEIYEEIYKLKAAIQNPTHGDYGKQLDVKKLETKERELKEWEER